MSSLPPNDSPTSDPANAVGPDAITQVDLDALKARIEQLQADVELARQANLTSWRQLLLNRVSLLYLTSARFVRNRVLPLFGYRWAVVASGTTLTWAGVAMLMSSFLFGLFGAAMGVVLFTCLLYLPASDILPSAIKCREELDAMLASQRRGFRQGNAQATSDLLALRERRKQWELWLQQRQMRGSIERRRQEVAASDWKSLRGKEFRQFLAEALRLLYYDVEETGQAGDHGIDLIATRDGNRIAISAKGYGNRKSVEHNAIKETVYGKNIRRCDACAIITNSYFAEQAKADAARLGCVIIDEAMLTSMIFGERDLWQECVAAKPVGDG